MKVTRLEATSVHGYLNISADFDPELTFLTGLNGSGKTSALRLLMGLLTPNIEDLATIAFKTASVNLLDEGQTVVVRASRTAERLLLQIGDVAEPLRLSTAELQLLLDARRRPSGRNPLTDKVSENPTFQAISTLSTPMYLGLDRRFFSGSTSEDVPLRRMIELERIFPEEPISRGPIAAELADVNILVSSALNEIRAAQEKLDKGLRDQILVRAFRYEPGEVVTRPPTRKSVEESRKLLTHAEHAVANLQLPVGDIRTTLEQFLDRMNKLAAAFEAMEKAGTKDTEETAQAAVEWVLNRQQILRLLSHIQLLDKYSADRARIHEPIERFLSLLNAFLTETKKRVQVTDRGNLVVILDDSTEERPLGALSSGERQLVVMLAHLSVNRNLARSGVFIVDEPELSLHISWQERLVRAIHEANPNVQLILATHSPAIILDRVEKCRSLS